MDDAVVVLVSVLVGGMLTALTGEWRARRDADRHADEARSAALAAWNRERLESTRRSLVGSLEQYRALAVGDPDAVAAAGADAQQPGYIGMLGDVAVARDYQDVVLSMVQRVGKGTSPEDEIRLAVLTANIHHAVDAQVERVIRGLPLATISKADAQAAGLIEVVDLADRVDLPGQPPSIAGRMAAAYLSLRRHLRRMGRSNPR